MSDFTELPDLASRRLGGGVAHASDEFFAAADNLIRPAAPVFEPGRFGPKGQLFDGWETRRRRKPGHEHAIVRLGVPGVVRGLVIDTTHFTGDHPAEAAVDACGMQGYPSPDELAATEWTNLLPRSPIACDTRNEFEVDVPRCFTHVRLSIHPDGGVARLRVHGEVVADPRLLGYGPVDLAAIENGGSVVRCSDMLRGAPGNLLLPGPAATAGEGWQTARRRDRGNDWVLVKLAAPGRPRLAELDTTHFKGNAPARARLRGIDVRDAGRDESGDAVRDAVPPDPAGIAGESDAWFDLLPSVRLQPDTRHRFPIPPGRPATHVRLDVYPDGGMARLRLYGALRQAEHVELAARWFNLLSESHARDVLTGAGLSVAEARRVLAARPLRSSELPLSIWPPAEA